MIIKRKALRSSNTKSPSDIVSEMLGNLFLKILFCAVATIVVYFFYSYFIFNFINFCIEYIIIGKPITHTNPYLLTVMILSIVIVDYKIIKDRTTKR